MKDIYAKSLKYFSKHPILNSCAHSAAGFGLAVILLHYMPESGLLNPAVGWILILFSIAVHIASIYKKP